MQERATKDSLFADDTLIYSAIESYIDDAKLQSDLTAIEEWAQK